MEGNGGNYDLATLIPFVNVALIWFAIIAIVFYIVTSYRLVKEVEGSAIVMLGVFLYIGAYVTAVTVFGMVIDSTWVRPAFWFVYGGAGVLAVRGAQQKVNLLRGLIERQKKERAESSD